MSAGGSTRGWSIKILLVCRYFSPDVHSCRLLATHLCANGHEVTILSTKHSYNGVYAGEPAPRSQVLDGMRVHRLPTLRERPRRAATKLVNTAMFLLGVTVHVLSRPWRYNLIIAWAMPPVAMGALIRLLSRWTRTDYVYNCMDIYPEAAIYLGLLKSGRVAKTLHRIDIHTCTDADAVVVLSEDMRRTLSERGPVDAKVHVINNPVTHPLEAPEAVSSATANDRPFTVLFAGNLGRFQGLESIIDAAHLLRQREDIHFLFVGTGSARPALQERAGDLVGRSVFFIDHQPLAAVTEVMKAADLGLVSLRPGIHRVGFPSKTIMYLEAGCRILAVVELDSELAAFVHREHVGRAIAPGDTQAIADAVVGECERRARGGHDRQAIHAVAVAHFSQPVIFSRWLALIDSVARKEPA